ncbi:hypothetical protein [Microbacterium hominis]|uniref:Uncharacterized protein n=1 Tax=Microbacterium hominis TaxID=162426 RepID=A0A7D4Q3U1_9MICO|nr:hypothetical protein [Microbacterium hominis]QKJ20311.1 hypothetical protein HQM25_13710 [Microbacterium hominis]
MTISHDIPRPTSSARTRRVERTTAIFPAVAVAVEERPRDAAHRALSDALAANVEARSAALAALAAREGDRRVAARALEADIAPMRIDEAERSRRRAMYAAAERAVVEARVEHDRAVALVEATRLVLATLAD